MPSSPPPPHRHRHPTPHRPLRSATIVVVVAALLLAGGADVAGASPLVLAAAPANLQDVINNLRNLLVTLLVALSTLFLTVAGVRYLAADGDPGEVERAKRGLRNALIGYSVAILAPVILGVLQSVVG